MAMQKRCEMAAVTAAAAVALLLMVAPTMARHTNLRVLRNLEEQAGAESTHDGPVNRNMPLNQQWCPGPKKIGSLWCKKQLTYRISRYLCEENRAPVDDAIRRAFALWSEHTDLTFTARPNDTDVHIDISFVPEEGLPGEGTSQVSRSFAPAQGGAVYLNNEYRWRINGSSGYGVKLFDLAAHEVGHALGLSHSDVDLALMSLNFLCRVTGNIIHPDDIAAIQAVYGNRTSPAGSTHTSTARATSWPNADQSLCADPRVDDMFNSAEGVTYAFKGDMYYQLNDAGVEPGYPKRIEDTWEGLPGNIDAALTDRNGKTYFFKGAQYWRYTGTRMDSGYPKAIAEGFPGIPDNIDAAMAKLGNRKLYFFKGSQYWVFNSAGDPPITHIFPRPLVDWNRVPIVVDAAIYYNGMPHLFKGSEYFPFDRRAGRKSYQTFPRPTGPWWFGCRNSSTTSNHHQ